THHDAGRLLEPDPAPGTTGAAVPRLFGSRTLAQAEAVVFTVLRRIHDAQRHPVLAAPNEVGAPKREGVVAALMAPEVGAVQPGVRQVVGPADDQPNGAPEQEIGLAD